MTGGVPSQPAERKELLMVFARNPVKGKVKSRLARTVGEANAYRIYWELMEHTARVIRPLEMDRTVHYTDSIHSRDPLNRSFLYKKIQNEGELGERMAQAFREAFDNGYYRVLVIGTDCYELETRHLKEAFQGLRYDQEVTIGPAADGGYYLLGMTRYIDRLFRNKEWGTSNVFLDTLIDLREEGIQYHLLPTLNDVDEEADLGELRRLLEKGAE